MISRTFSYLPERLFLECPDFLGHQFSNWRKVAGVNGDPVRKIRCMGYAGTYLPYRFAPYGIVQCGKVQIAKRGMH